MAVVSLSICTTDTPQLRKVELTRSQTLSHSYRASETGTEPCLLSASLRLHVKLGAKMYVLHLLALLLLSTGSQPSPTPSADLNRLVVFGDSLSDTGETNPNEMQFPATVFLLLVSELLISS